MNTDTFIVEVKNLPNYDLDKYIVARVFEGYLWFYGTYETVDECRQVCQELGETAVMIYNNNLY